MSKKKGKKTAAEEDLSTIALPKKYFSKVGGLGIAPNKTFKAAIELALENQEHLRKVHITEEIGANAVRGICESLVDTKYKHLTDIWFIKGGLGDEGAKYVGQFLEMAGREVHKYNESKKKEKDRYTFTINLTENEIGSLGCHHIGRSLDPVNLVPLKELILDFNSFSCGGIEQLAQGLVLNSTIQKLSLNYCGLDLESVRYLQQILSYIDSDLRYLFLEGNYLRNEGIYQLFRALEANEWLEELNIANNQFGECEDIPVVEKICEVLTKNNSLQVYDVRGNALYDDSIRKFLECIKMYKTVCKFEVPFLIQKELLEELKKTLKKRKRKKKKRKGKGKKSKKKKSKK